VFTTECDRALRYGTLLVRQALLLHLRYFSAPGRRTGSRAGTGRINAMPVVIICLRIRRLVKNTAGAG